jgi:hypothetical protein
MGGWGAWLEIAEWVKSADEYHARTLRERRDPVTLMRAENRACYLEKARAWKAAGRPSETIPNGRKQSHVNGYKLLPDAAFAHVIRLVEEVGVRRLERYHDDDLTHKALRLAVRASGGIEAIGQADPFRLREIGRGFQAAYIGAWEQVHANA